MNFRRVFVDGNVIIDLFDERRKNHNSSKEAIRKLLSQGAQLMTSSDLITTIYYVLSKIDRKKALADIEKVLQIFSVIPFGSQELTKTLNLMKQDRKFKDLEDTLQYVLAKAQECELILTNDADFHSPNIKTLTSEEVMKSHDSKAL